MGLYEKLSASDVLAQIERQIADGQMTLTKGKFLVRDQLGCDVNWVHQKIAKDRQCKKWKMYFNIYHFIPENCHKCFKIVVRLKTLKDLFKMRELQQRLDYFSKCGPENRKIVPALYGAYWYCPIKEGLRGARKLHAEIQAEITKVSPEDTVAILKRGCSEMELSKGASDTWVYSLNDAKLELLLESLFEVEESLDGLPKYVEHHVLRKWIEWAYEHGDETYLDYVSKPLIAPAVTYHDSAHRDEDFR